MKDNYIVVNFSGGKDSTAMVLRMIELNEHIDEVVCCDTYKEFPAMYRHIEKVRVIIENANIKFTLLKSDKSFDYYMFDHQSKRKNPLLIGLKGYSWADSKSRWCTSNLKTNIINRYFAELRKKYSVINCIGLASDEGYRLNRETNQTEDKRYPLVEWGWTEKDCLDYCYKCGFDWEGLYKLFSRVSCWCCPLQSLNDLRSLREHFPALWEELKDMDKRTWRKFRVDYSVEELEIRFDLENEFLAQGKSIRNRQFFEELKKRIEERIK